MAKKTAEPVRSVAPESPAKTSKTKPKATKPAAAAVSKAPPAARSGKAPPKRSKAKPVKGYTTEDVALRAYYIAEKRQKAGLHGSPHQDWIEAEKQLAAESRKQTRAKSGPPSKSRKAK